MSEAQRWIPALRISMAMCAAVPCAISVEDCVYNMQLAERCGEADIAMRAEEFTDSTVSPNWFLIYAMAPEVIRHQRAARFQLSYKLDGIDRAKRERTSDAWEQKNKVQRAVLRSRYRTDEWRKMDNERRRAKRALSRSEKHSTTRS
ncbi:MAG: hypothetical protein QM813_17075 [Verrucomicrobiota bacterium]